MKEVDDIKLRAEKICKSFGGVKALKGLDLEVRKAAIHCIVGENGAGKSTLMKIFSGVVEKDSGFIAVDGKQVEITGPRDSKNLGIGIIYQEFSLVPDMTVAENIFLDSLSDRLWISPKELSRKAGEIIASFGMSISPTAMVKDLSVAEMQIVEIAKALSKKVNILILDEPTAVLAGPEIKVLFAILKDLQAKGMTILYISHRLEEILEIGDEVSVIKDGERTREMTRAEISKDAIIKAMTGREMGNVFPRRTADIGEEVFRTECLARRGAVREVSLNVRAGEVVGIAGLVGSGRSEFARLAFGIDRADSGAVFVDGKRIDAGTSRKALRSGIGLAPENRKECGLALDMSIAANITMANMTPILRNFLFIDGARENAITDNYAKQLNIRLGANYLPASSLSGGNQQKVVFAKWLNTGAKLLILDEPTRGVDVGARYEIYSIINDLAAKGRGILVISSEMTELIGICDRIYVFNEGRVSGCLKGDEISEEGIMRLAIPERPSMKSIGR